MKFVDTGELYKVAFEEGIVIEYWEFPDPLKAIYMHENGLPPNIGISKNLNNVEFRCILAEELGHYYTSAGKGIPESHWSYYERLNVGRTEYKAMKWAAEFLMPIEYLKRAIVWECTYSYYSIADYFRVTPEMAKFRMKLDDVKELVHYTKGFKYG